MSKFAHFESVDASDLMGLYKRHAEVARQIHQDSLREFTGDSSLEVDLVEQSPVDGNPEVLNNLSNYDVVSVSSGLDSFKLALRKGDLADIDIVNTAEQTISELDMPIYVVAAGNEGETGAKLAPRISDFIRTSMNVGEAAVAGEGTPFVEAHSSRIRPTLVSDSPFNNGEQYPYFDLNPSLEGHQDLVESWVKQQDSSEELSRIEIQEKVDDYMKSPEKLHTDVIKSLKKSGYDITEKDGFGYVTGIDGTSFSGPELAGYMSGAMHEQSQRELQSLPILSKEEISGLARMSTNDIYHREGQEGLTAQFKNSAGVQFSEAGGHGVFNPELFRALVDEAYNKIENNPDIVRGEVNVKIPATEATFMGGGYSSLFSWCIR